MLPVTFKEVVDAVLADVQNPELTKPEVRICRVLTLFDVRMSLITPIYQIGM